MSDKIREAFEAWWKSTMNTQMFDLYRFGDGYDNHDTNRSWMAWQAALAQQPAQAVPDYRVYAVIDSMGWDLDDQEKDDMYRLCRTMLAAAPAAPVAQEPVAWCVPPMTRPYWGEYAEADAKAEAARIGGTARAIPLYTAPPAADQQDTVAVPRELLQITAQMLQFYLTRLYCESAEGCDIRAAEAAAAELRALLDGGEE